jgi:hypothetical protein
VGLRAVTVLAVWLVFGVSPARAAGVPDDTVRRTSVLVDGVFAFNIEAFSFGFRLHPRAAIRIWRASSPERAEGTLDLGAFGGWSHVPPSFYDRMLMTGDGTYDGTGAHWGMLLASVGSTAHTFTRHGHTVSGGVHLLGGWMTRSERASITYERYGIEGSYDETVHGAEAGVLTTLAVLVHGRAGPVLEASYFFLTTHRGCSSWHLGLGFAVRIGAGAPP